MQNRVDLITMSSLNAVPTSIEHLIECARYDAQLGIGSLANLHHQRESDNALRFVLCLGHVVIQLLVEAIDLYLCMENRMYSLHICIFLTRTRTRTHLAGKTVTLYVVLRAATILGAVVYVNLLELIAIGQRTAGYVNVLLCVLVHAKDE